MYLGIKIYIFLKAHFYFTRHSEKVIFSVKILAFRCCFRSPFFLSFTHFLCFIYILYFPYFFKGCLQQFIVKKRKIKTLQKVSFCLIKCWIIFSTFQSAFYFQFWTKKIKRGKARQRIFFPKKGIIVRKKGETSRIFFSLSTLNFDTVPLILELKYSKVFYQLSYKYKTHRKMH